MAAPFVTKDWRNKPDTSTPITAEALEDLEKRVTDYAASLAGGLAEQNVAVATGILNAGTGQGMEIAMAGGYRVTRVVTDRPARVRLYLNDGKRDADAGRPVTVDPQDYPTPNATPDHGCMIEVVTAVGKLDIPVAPNRDGNSSQGVNVAARIDNLDVVGGVVNVTIYFQKIAP